MTRNPYGPPRRPARAGPKKSWSPSLLWWALLVAPFLGLALVLATSRALYELGRPVSDAFREVFIETTGAWAKGSTLAAFMFPSAWILERIVGRARVALPILVVSLYVLGVLEVLETLDYLEPSHLLIKVVKVLNGLFILAFFPLAVVWAVVALRRRRRR